MDVYMNKMNCAYFCGIFLLDVFWMLLTKQMWLCCRLSSLHSDWWPWFRGASSADSASWADGWCCVWVSGCPGCHAVPSCSSHCARWVHTIHMQKTTHKHRLQMTSHHWDSQASPVIELQKNCKGFHWCHWLHALSFVWGRNECI